MMALITFSGGTKACLMLFDVVLYVVCYAVSCFLMLFDEYYGHLEHLKEYLTTLLK